MSAHESIQSKGVCWDCGREDALPTYSYNGGVIVKLGWTCRCGRWWPVCGSDILNWARKIIDNPTGVGP